MQSAGSLNTISLILNLVVVYTTKQYMESSPKFLCKFRALMSCEGAVCVKRAEPWVPIEKMLQNPTKTLVHWLVLPHTQVFKQDSFYSIDFQKLWLGQTDPAIKIQPRDRYLSDTSFLHLNKAMTVQQHHCLVLKAGKCFDVENAIVNRTFSLTSNLMNVVILSGKSFRKSFDDDISIHGMHQLSFP